MGSLHGSDGLNHAPAALVHGSKDLKKRLFFKQKYCLDGLNHAPAALVHGSKDLEKNTGYFL